MVVYANGHQQVFILLCSLVKLPFEILGTASLDTCMIACPVTKLKKLKMNPTFCQKKVIEIGIEFQ